MATISEAEFSQTFQELLGDQPTGPLGSSVAFARELECQRGRPDFVLTPSASLVRLSKRRGIADALSRPPAAMLLSLLYHSSPRTEAHLFGRAALRRDSFIRALGTLSEVGLVQEVGPSRYVTAPWLPKDIEFWAFELKIKNWRRAFYQALRYKAFAHRALIVLPLSRAERIRGDMAPLRQLGIGVAGLDPESGKLRILSRSRRTRPSSRFHHLFAVGKFLQMQASTATPHIV